MAANPSNMQAEDFISYLAKHGISDYKQRGKEVSFPCPFHGCDDDHRSNEEFHCGFNLDTCTYNCFKCGEKGNFITLQKFFGDYEQSNAIQNSTKKKGPSLETAVKHAYENTHESERVCKYFNGRGINNDSINKFKLGLWKYEGHDRLMIPITDRFGKVVYLKLRRTPEDEQSDEVAKAMGGKSQIKKYLVYPAGAKLILVGEDDLIKSTSDNVLICEGELDRIIAIQEGVDIPVVTSGGGAQTFKDEWIEQLKDRRNIYICMDCDDAGRRGAEALGKRIAEKVPMASVYIISLPFDDDTHADLTDYFVEKRGTAEELFSKYSKFRFGSEPIDVSQFKEIGIDDITRVLDTTIKYDTLAKSMVFLSMTTAYLGEEQLNNMLNGSSSCGKSFIVLEVSKIFPQQDILTYGKITPTAFYYSVELRRIDEKTGQPYIDLSHRIMIFTELPDSKLQENLRSLLSHDEKKVPFAITNKGKRGENAASEGYILGYPSAFFCSANMIIDEQEQTRCIILSPETTRQKVLAGIDAYLAKSKNRSAYEAVINSNEERNQLMERIRYIKSLNVDDVDIDDIDYLRAKFLESQKYLPPKAQREIKKFISLVKAMALLNAPFRMVNGRIVASNKDVDEILKLWIPLARSASHGISEQIYDFYVKVILSAFRNKKEKNPMTNGVTYKEITAEYFNQYGYLPNGDTIRKQFIPALEIASLITVVKEKKSGNNDKDGRESIIIPIVFPDDDLEEKS